MMKEAERKWVKKLFFLNESIGIGSRLRTIREYSGLSRDQFGALFHSQKSTVYQWENGRNVPRLSKLISISQYFNVSLDCILSGRAVGDDELEVRISGMTAPKSFTRIRANPPGEFLTRFGMLPTLHRERLSGYFDALCKEAGI